MLRVEKTPVGGGNVTNSKEVVLGEGQDQPATFINLYLNTPPYTSSGNSLEMNAEIYCLFCL